MANHLHYCSSNQLFALRVQRSSWLIQQQNGAWSQKRTRNCNALLLSNTQT
jgi:hypothetical protein